MVTVILLLLRNKAGTSLPPGNFCGDPPEKQLLPVLLLLTCVSTTSLSLLLCARYATVVVCFIGKIFADKPKSSCIRSEAALWCDPLTCRRLKAAPASRTHTGGSQQQLLATNTYLRLLTFLQCKHTDLYWALRVCFACKPCAEAEGRCSALLLSWFLEEDTLTLCSANLRLHLLFICESAACNGASNRAKLATAIVATTVPKLK